MELVGMRINRSRSFTRVEMSVRDEKSERIYYKKLDGGSDSNWTDRRNTAVTTSKSQELERLYKSNLDLEISAHLLGIDRSTLKFWCESGKVEARKQHGKWLVNPSDIGRILEIYQAVGGPDKLFSISESAGLSGLENATLRKYLQEGIPVPHIDEDDIQKAISGVTGFRYDGRRRVLHLPEACTLINGGNQYLDERSVEVLMLLNEPVVNGWIPIREYARIVAADSGQKLSKKDLEKLYKYIKHLCYHGRIRADKGLNSRAWYIEPSQADRNQLEEKIKFYLQAYGNEAVSFINDFLERKRFNDGRAEKRWGKKTGLGKSTFYEELLYGNLLYGNLLLCIGDAQSTEPILKNAVTMNLRSRAALYSVNGNIVGLIYLGDKKDLKSLGIEIVSVYKKDLKGDEVKALDDLTERMINQRRKYLPFCAIPLNNQWEALLGVYARQTQR